MSETVTKANDSKKVNFIDIVILLLKRSKMIIYGCAAVTILTYLIFVILPNKYVVTARVLPPQQNITLSAQLLNSLGGGVTPGSSGAGGFGGMVGGLLGLKSAADLYVAMMTGDTVFDRIIEQFKLREYFKAKYIEDARKQLGRMVKVESGKKDGLIIIRVTDKDPKKAASIANAFIKELDLLLKSMAAEEAKGRLAFLEKERTQANVNLAKAEEELRCFSEKNSVLQIDTQTRGTLEYVASLRAAIDAKEIQLQVLRQQATPLNYDLIRAETEIKGLKEKLRAIDTYIDKNYGSEVCLSINNVPSLGLVYLRLYREVKFQEGLNQLYSKLVEIARLDVAKDVSILQIVDEAKPPEKRSNKRLIPAIMVGVATFLIMIIVVLGDEYWYKRRSAIDEEKLEQLKRLLKQWRPNLRKEEKNY